MLVAPHIADALLRAGWVVRVDVGERFTTGASAACLRFELEAERRGWSGRSRILGSKCRHAMQWSLHVCIHRGPVAIARRGWAKLALAEKWRRRRVRRELVEEAYSAVARSRVAAMWSRAATHGASRRTHAEASRHWRQDGQAPAD